MGTQANQLIFFQTSEDVLINFSCVVRVAPAKGGINEEDAYREKGCYIYDVNDVRIYHNDFEELLHKMKWVWGII